MWTSWPLVSTVNFDRFVSRSKDHLVKAMDALEVLWDQYTLIYAFPTLKHLPYLLCRIDGILMILIALGWHRCMWYINPSKTRVLEDTLWVVLDNQQYLSQGMICHPASHSLALTAWQLKLRF